MASAIRSIPMAMWSNFVPDPRSPGPIERVVYAMHSAIVFVVTRTPADLGETIERAMSKLAAAAARAEPDPPESVRLVAEPVILVTGYEPFGSHTVNPSQELAKVLDGRRIGNCAVAQSAVLPVHHLEASRHVSALLGEMAPVAVVAPGPGRGPGPAGPRAGRRST